MSARDRMPLRFNHLLETAEIPLAEVRLLRHQDVVQNRSVHRLWCDWPEAFEEYQAGQAASNRADLAGSYWASFVAAPERQTLFVGLYRVEARRPVTQDTTTPLLGAPVAAGGTDQYVLTRLEALSAYAGLLYIDWGDGLRRWIQRADRQNKAIVELRRARKEPDFPGYSAFMAQLLDLASLPSSWTSALSAVRGVYLLTCPRTGEHYVGCAHGHGGLLGRWLDYVQSGHGGNVGLKARDASDYRVSILEVAGSTASVDDILAMEALWKRKLQSALNRN